MNLDEVMAKLNGLPDGVRQEVIDLAVAQTADRKFIPSPGPQTEAYFSKADLLLYGGAGGGGKSSLLSGLALTEHRRSLFIRRHYNDLLKGGGLIDEVLKFYGSRDGFNGSPPAMLRFDEGKVITFGGVGSMEDAEKFQGTPRDLLGIDEATQLREDWVRFLMGWVRSEVEGQRRRTILATNPPLSSTGDWVIGMFRPWLDLTHPNPAENGELRWFVSDPDGNDLEVAGPEPHSFPGISKPVKPKSRTFIPSMLRDNPFLSHDDDYASTLDSLPEPLRSALRDGNFMAGRVDNAFQVIPTQWIVEAQLRWSPDPPSHAPMSALAADIAQGGADTTTLAARYDGWFDELEQTPGKDTPTGNEVAGLIVSKRRNNCAVIVDMGGGYGGATMMRLKDNEIPVTGHKGAEASNKRTADQQFGFYNKRAEIYWRFREALDPSQDGGSSIALPDDPELMSDLTAATFEITSRGVKIMTKEKVVEKLGRSPDKGDAVVMAWSAGPKLQTHGTQWRKFQGDGRSGGRPKVINSRMAARRKR